MKVVNSREVITHIVGGSILAALAAFLSNLIIPASPYKDIMVYIAIGLLFAVGVGATTTLMKLKEYVGLRRRLKSGMIRIYGSYEEAESDILESMRNSESVKVLVQMGRKEFLGEQHSFLYEALTGLKAKKISVAFASKDSPYFSGERSGERGKQPGHFKTLLDQLLERMNQLAYECEKNQNKITLIRHKEPFLFKLFLFDDEAFIMFYTYPKDNDLKASWFRVKNEEGSLYRMVDDYYSDLEVRYAIQG